MTKRLFVVCHIYDQVTKCPAICDRFQESESYQVPCKKQEVEISPGEKKFARDDVRLDHLGVDVLPVDYLQNILAFRDVAR